MLGPVFFFSGVHPQEIFFWGYRKILRWATPPEKFLYMQKKFGEILIFSENVCGCIGKWSIFSGRQSFILCKKARKNLQEHSRLEKFCAARALNWPIVISIISLPWIFLMYFFPPEGRENFSEITAKNKKNTVSKVADVGKFSEKVSTQSGKIS